MIRVIDIVFLCIIGTAGLFQCSIPPLASGNSSSETTNGYVVGSLVRADGSPASETNLRVVPDGYDPAKEGPGPDSLTGTTDEAGDFILPVSGSGIFNIEGVQQGTGERVLIPGITVAGRDTEYIRTHVIQKPGAIKFIMAAGGPVNGFVYVPGTTRFAAVQSGKATIDSVPAGHFPALRWFSPSDTAANRIVATNFTVTPASTVFITGNHAWGFSKKLFLNTTSSGAAVGGTVCSFPVLVRLSAGNFVFSQAKSGGEDIRFVKADGTQLPFEIERWDPAAQRAELWVRVDTVYGNDSTHSFTMLWGDSSSAGSSNGGAVFDTAVGFQGVWHLGEAGNAIARDATGNRYDGTPSDTAPAGAAGEIGTCRSFNGSSNGIRMNGTANGKLNFQENGVYSMSAWVFADTLDLGYHLIAGKGNEQYFLALKRSNPDTTMRWEFVEYQDKGGWQITQEMPSTRTWTYLTGIRNGATQYLYVNGTLADSTIEVTPPIISRNTGDDVTIGKFLSVSAYAKEGKCPFIGKIDEVRIANTAPGADWIKLCYMNQKEQDALVKW
jgi:hypothetical protein